MHVSKYSFNHKHNIFIKAELSFSADLLATLGAGFSFLRSDVLFNATLAKSMGTVLNINWFYENVETNWASEGLF